ncbi:MAG TPA: nucleosidase [Marmoricola sp.]|nr:nucleosidase [Marmoricola sp.]HNI70627.1 nucleosidase [Marmoricola sp.]
MNTPDPWSLTSPLLVVAAATAETTHVPTHLPVLVTGIGKTAAAIAVTTQLAQWRTQGRGLDELLLVNIGSAGALHDHYEGLHEVGVVRNHDMNAEIIRGMGYDPEEEIEVGEGVHLASGDTFVADPQTRTRLAQWADLVDMEGYALALTARRFGCQLRMVKHVSDQADEGALDWPTLVERSAVALGGWLAENYPGRVL